MTPRQHAKTAAKQLPARLKAARKRAKLTQAELVTRADFSPVALSKLETGVNRPTFENLVALAYALNISPNFLTGWEDTLSSRTNAETRMLLNRLMLAAEHLTSDWLTQLISLAEQAKCSERE